MERMSEKECMQNMQHRTHYGRTISVMGFEAVEGRYVSLPMLSWAIKLMWLPLQDRSTGRTRA